MVNINSGDCTVKNIPGDTLTFLELCGIIAVVGK